MLHYCLLCLLIVSSLSDAREFTENDVTLARGAEIYAKRCTVCHAADGKGQGRMAKIITSPPPANLTLSTLSTEELAQIIREGGQFVGRSSSMPAWKEQLSNSDIYSIIIFIKSIRK
ncbi:MAG: cytochrome c [Cellvibrionaceae bacterium]|nr:cytochrome c [Cellvibrionaceae bacterium]